MVKTYWDTLATPPIPVHVVPDAGAVALTGTDGSSAESGGFRFKSAEDSNVSVKINDRVSPPEIEIGVYYV